MQIDLSTLWVSVWNKNTRGLKAVPIDEALKDINHDVVTGGDPQHCVIAVMESLEDCLAYNREIKRILKQKQPEAPGAIDLVKRHYKDCQCSGCTASRMPQGPEATC